MRSTSILGAIALLAAAHVADAQTPSPTPPAPVANPADVASDSAIIAALYASISGPAGQTRDWARFRSLFITDARLIVAPPRVTPQRPPRVMSPEQYITVAGPGLEQGFFEREIFQISETFGGVTHRFSTYESRRTAQDPQPFARGINSIQLLDDGQRWWVVTVYWDSERPGNPIPAKYLPR